MRAHTRTGDEAGASASRSGVVGPGGDVGAARTRPSAASLTPAEVVRVQRLAGNRATYQLLLLTGGPPTPGDRPSASRDLAGPSGPTGQAVQRQPRDPAPGARTPNPGTPPEPPDYDRDRTVAPPVPAGLTRARITELLDGKVKTRDLTAYAVRGVPRGGPGEIFLLAVIYGLAKRAQWGTESDLVMPIDWPAKPGGPAPQGRVTVTFDRSGSATATLIAAGPVPQVPQTTYAAGVARLTGPDIGFASVTGWSGTGARDAAEISTVLAALDLLRARAPQGLTALAGVELIRVPSLPSSRAGEFFAGSQVALGDTADVRPYLKLADRAFGSDDVQFAGGGGTPAAPTVPASFQLILHEVGHAIENEKQRAARSAYVTAHTAAEAATKAMTVDPVVFEAERKAAERKGRKARDAFYKKQADAYKAAEAANAAAATRKQEASTALNATLDTRTKNTKRLQKFVDLVTTNKIRRFTSYAAQSWPQHPEEFYAEAYSLWLADPTFVRTHYKIIYDFFEGGDYLR